VLVRSLAFAVSAMPREIRERDGQGWVIGDGADVAWLAGPVDHAAGRISLVPPAFAAYCQLDLPDDIPGSQINHDKALVATLSTAPAARKWWLGYLEYGIGIDLPFDDAPRTNLFSWNYVLIQAGVEQALNWRASESPSRGRAAYRTSSFPLTTRGYLSPIGMRAGPASADPTTSYRVCLITPTSAREPIASHTRSGGRWNDHDGDRIAAPPAAWRRGRSDWRPIRTRHRRCRLCQRRSSDGGRGMKLVCFAPIGLVSS
jgi:hypothetical protein